MQYLPFIIIYSPSNPTVTFDFRDLQEVYCGNLQIWCKFMIDYVASTTWFDT